MRRLLIAAMLVAACSNAGGGSRSCASNSDCDRAQVCVDRSCRTSIDAGPLDSGLVNHDSGNRPDAIVADSGPPCVAIESSPETMCNGLDDDCNGRVDDVDVGGDGICDCLRIGVIGDPGANSSSSFQAWLMARGTTVTRFGLDDAPLTAEELDVFDLVILDRLRRDYTTAEATVLADFVTSGHGVMSMTGYTGGGEDRTRPSSLLSVIGLEYLDGLHSGPITMFATHPLTDGLTSVTFLGGYLVGVVDGVPGTNTIVASLPEGPAAIAQERGMGHVYVWGDEWVEFDSEWSTMPEITRFWVDAINWLGPHDSCLVLF